jgi:threonine aldolase
LELGIWSFDSQSPRVVSGSNKIMRERQKQRARQRHFASDNYAGICPEAFAAMAEANAGHEISYGDDSWTKKASDMIREAFEKDCEVFFVFNGTSANSLSLASLCQSYNSALCHELAHLESAECGAPEFFSNGAKVLLLPGKHAKIDCDAIEHAATKRTDLHYPKPRVLSLTQPTEVGTVYSLAELKRLADCARRFGLRVHMDGARFANAVVSLGVKPKELTWKAGVDVLSLGGTKNGLAVGEAVVFFNRELARDFEYRCKQGGQLASKMRFLSAPWVGVLRNGAWLKHAKHANAMAQRLESRIRKLDATEEQIRIVHPVDSNAVFAKMSDDVVDKMHKCGWKFYTHVGTEGEARLMCAWDTTAKDVDDFGEDLASIVRH